VDIEPPAGALLAVAEHDLPAVAPRKSVFGGMVTNSLAISVNDSTQSLGIEPLHLGVNATPAGRSERSIAHSSWKWDAASTCVTDELRPPALPMR
jgi:hypothetical protein